MESGNGSKGVEIVTSSGVKNMITPVIPQAPKTNFYQ